MADVDLTACKAVFCVTGKDRLRTKRNNMVTYSWVYISVFEVARAPTAVRINLLVTSFFTRDTDLYTSACCSYKPWK